MGTRSRRGRRRPELFVVASTGAVTFVAGVGGLLQNNLYVAVPTLAFAAVLCSWTVYRQSQMSSTPISTSPSARAESAAGTNDRVVPRQLPAAVAHFAGRAGELAKLTGLLESGAAAGGTVVISAIGGTAGVGKTALAVYWAHQVADRFPDGQLYVNLRGFDPGGQVMDPADAVRQFLDALDVLPERIPTELDAQAALYRSQLAGRRMLILLDNARDATHVRPLLPGAPTCLVLVTSRDRLSGLVATHGAYPLGLDMLSQREAHELLTWRIGADRVSAEPQAVNEMITRCARLPLALTVAAARAATCPTLPLAILAGQLREVGARLDALSTGEVATDVQAVFSWSYQALTPLAARLFRLLGLHPGPDISSVAAASLAGEALPQARRALAELATANLIVEHVPGRYTVHDLLREYASRLVHLEEPEDQRRAAVVRTLSHYLQAADTASRLLNPARDRINLTDTPAGVTTESLTTASAALAWFTTEHPVLLAAINLGAAAGVNTHVWQLAWAISTFLDQRGHWHDQAISQRTALAAAERLDDLSAPAHAHRQLARAHTRLREYDDALAHIRQSLDLFGRVDDRVLQAHCHLDLGEILEIRGQHAEAVAANRRALELYRGSGSRSGQANALANIGWYQAQLGDYQQALARGEEALILRQEVNDPYGEAGTWDTLGYAHDHLGDHNAAVACYRRAVAIYQNLSDRYWEADTLTHLGDAHCAAGDLDDARATWLQALTILDDLQHPDADTVRAKLHRLDPGEPSA